MNSFEMPSKSVKSWEPIAFAVLAPVAVRLGTWKALCVHLMLGVDSFEVSGEVLSVLKFLAARGHGAEEARIMSPLMGRKLMLLVECLPGIALVAAMSTAGIVG